MMTYKEDLAAHVVKGHDAIAQPTSCSICLSHKQLEAMSRDQLIAIATELRYQMQLTMIDVFHSLQAEQGVSA